MVKSLEELNKIINETYEICDASFNENKCDEFMEYVDSYLSNSYPELTTDEVDIICKCIENIVENEDKISKEKITKIVEKYDDCKIEELYENHSIMGNWCILTCDLKEIRTEYNLNFVGGIFDLLGELKKYTNIKNMNCETMNGENGFYEYVSFEW